ncbi:leucine-rich repeat-containing G-protein coupled receptor 4-like [Trichogramma pretiosum]|uniref:leucine-rich repeat-containing G-protein coupled receptor 4-like n=1 Tax=Trichogramma pretiosum TaxID=7493 RepID=UPI000C718A38|nr:leucine-rich repeat-containing G-protein coupled receptor 4-like [Trichogramma pretiosum]
MQCSITIATVEKKLATKIKNMKGNKSENFGVVMRIVSIFLVRKSTVTFPGLTNLDSLVLAHNKIQKVPARAFARMTQLNSLELEGNMINFIDSDAFIGLEENLQYLKLGDNDLHQIPSDALRRLHRLRHLDLRANNISVVSEDAFTGYGDSITFLNLQKNTIKFIPSSTFENLNSLEILNLQNNKLSILSEDLVDSTVDTLKVIDITDNPLVCDCKLYWFVAWLQNLQESNEKEDLMSKKKTICTMKSEHREYHLQNMPVYEMGCSPSEKYKKLSSSSTTYKTSTFVLISFLIAI